MYHVSSRWLAAGALVLSATLAACGGSGGGSPATAPATAAPAATAATAVTAAAVTKTAGSAGCPTAVMVGTALGITLPKPTTVPQGSEQLPAGATGVACEYAGKAMNVIIELITGVDPSYISKFSDKFPVPYANVSGVGDQARSFSQTLGAGKDNEGVVATKGTNLVAITATATPASLAQIEDLIKQLL